MLNWGILGPGRIAEKFAEDLSLSSQSRLAAVGSRSIERAESFASKYRAAHFFDSYESLANCPDVDIIYIATPHVFHYENTLQCLNAGKHVLCEKPFAMNSKQASEMVALAQNKGLFLMEGIWTRFIPCIEKLHSILEEEKIGSIETIRADFGFRASPDKVRLFDKKLGGGALLDVGIYPIYLALSLLGLPNKILASARMNANQIDTSNGMLFEYENHSLAILESSIEANTPIEAYLYGSEAIIKIHSRFHHPEKLTIDYYSGVREEIKLPYSGNGYLHEIQEVEQCLALEKTESDKLPLDFTLQLSETLDQILTQINLTY